MVGQGVLRECVLDPEVDLILLVGRSSAGKVVENAKIREILSKDLYNLSNIEADLTGYDACLFCLGVSSAGMKEADYRHVTFDLTLSVAKTLLPLNPKMTFIYVSGAGTDSTAKGRSMWARVKGETENALLAMPFKSAVMFRPGFIQPMNGVVSKTTLYRVIYAVVSPLYPVLTFLFPKLVTNTEQLGRSMLAAIKNGAKKPIMEVVDINETAENEPKNTPKAADSSD